MVAWPKRLQHVWDQASIALWHGRLVISRRSTVEPPPTIILLVQFYNERQNLPAFFENVLPHVDGIIGLDDGSEDGSGEYFLSQPKVLKVVHRPVHFPHIWDEPANRQSLMDAARQFKPDWLLALDVDERLQWDFRRRAQPHLRAAQSLGCNAISQPLRELWDSETNYRCDGVWGLKRRQRLFQWSDDHQVDQKAFHGVWTSTNGAGTVEATGAINKSALSERPNRSKVLHTRLPIYHLGMLTEAQRAKRVEKYERLDPQHEYQAIGYAYLNCKQGLRTASVRPNQHFRAPSRLMPPAESIFERRIVGALSAVLARMVKLEPDQATGWFENFFQRELALALKPADDVNRFWGAGHWLKLQGAQSFAHRHPSRLPCEADHFPGRSSRPSSQPRSFVLVSQSLAPKLDLSGASGTSGNRDFIVGLNRGNAADGLVDCVQRLLGRLASCRGYRAISLEPFMTLLPLIKDREMRLMAGTAVLKTLFERFPSSMVFYYHLSPGVHSESIRLEHSYLINACKHSQLGLYHMTMVEDERQQGLSTVPGLHGFSTPVLQVVQTKLSDHERLSPAGSAKHDCEECGCDEPDQYLRDSVHCDPGDEHFDRDGLVRTLVHIQAHIEQRECSPYFAEFASRDKH